MNLNRQYSNESKQTSLADPKIYKEATIHRMPYVAGHFFVKEPLIIGLFCKKWHTKMKHPMGLRHPVPQTSRANLVRWTLCCATAQGSLHLYPWNPLYVWSDWSSCLFHGFNPVERTLCSEHCAVPLHRVRSPCTHTTPSYSQLQIGWHRIWRLFLKTFNLVPGVPWLSWDSSFITWY